MNGPRWARLLGILAAGWLWVCVHGCQYDASSPAKSTESRQQSAADKKLIDAQGYCPISKEKLGSMGDPVKIMIQDQPVFLCCEHCKKDALAHPEKTLAALEEMKRKSKE